jgi:hypothetical protein
VSSFNASLKDAGGNEEAGKANKYDAVAAGRELSHPKGTGSFCPISESSGQASNFTLCNDKNKSVSSFSLISHPDERSALSFLNYQFMQTIQTF